MKEPTQKVRTVSTQQSHDTKNDSNAPAQVRDSAVTLGFDYTTITSLMHRDPRREIIKRVTIKESRMESPLDALYIHHTADCNIITPTNICIPYPTYTTRLCYAVPPGTRMSKATRTSLRMLKLKREKFVAKGQRRMFDKDCMIVCLDSSKERREKDEMTGQEATKDPLETTEYTLL